MKSLIILSSFSTNELRPVYFAKNVSPDGTTVLVGIAGKFRSFADEAARQYPQPLDNAQFEAVRQRALVTFRERFAQQKHQPFGGSDDDILRSFGQLIISADGAVRAFAWGRFRFSSVRDGLGQADLPTVLIPGQYILGDVEGAGITTTVAQNLATITSLDSLTQATGSLADPFMIATVDVASPPVVESPAGLPPPKPAVYEVPLEPSVAEIPARPTNEFTAGRAPRLPVNNPASTDPVQRPEPALPWKSMTFFLLTLLVLGGLGGGYYWWKTIRPKHRNERQAQIPTDTTGYDTVSENGTSSDDESMDADSTVIENPEESNAPVVEPPVPSQAEQLLQQYRNQPDSLMYLINAAEQVSTIPDADRQQALRSEIDRERQYRFTEQTQTARTAYDRAVLYLLADQQSKAGASLQTAQRAYEMAMLLQPDKADSIKPQLDQVLEKINSLKE